MRRKVLAAIIILCLASILGGLSLTHKFWGVGIFPGYVMVHAYAKYPTPEGKIMSDLITVEIFHGDKLIGYSNSEIQLTSGVYILKFGSYTTEYEIPSDEQISVMPFETTHITINYLALYGYLIVDTKLYDAYNENTSSVNAEIFVDGQSEGFQAISKRFNASELGSYNVSFAELEGCIKPKDQTVFVTKANITRITGTYKKILTPEQEVYVFCRGEIRGYLRPLKESELNATSNIDVDVFLRWIRDNRITTPKCYVSKPYVLPNDWYYGYCKLKYFVARYGGIYEREIVGAAVEIFYRLNSCGIDLKFYGHLMAMHYKDDAEYIVIAVLDFEKIHYVNVERKIYRFQESDIDSLPNLSGIIDVVGMGFTFLETRQVYVKTDSISIPFEEKYVPPFREYANLPERSRGWDWMKWKDGYSFDPRELFRSLLIEEW